MTPRTYFMVQSRGRRGGYERRSIMVQAESRAKAVAKLREKGLNDAYKLTWILNQGFAPGTIVWGNWEHSKDLEEYFQ